LLALATADPAARIARGRKTGGPRPPSGTKLCLSRGAALRILDRESVGV